MQNFKQKSSDTAKTKLKLLIILYTVLTVYNVFEHHGEGIVSSFISLTQCSHIGLLWERMNSNRGPMILLSCPLPLSHAPHLLNNYSDAQISLKK